MTELGRLQRVDLRDIWQTEAQDFTPWLAREENLAILGDTIALDLELEAQEKNVGPFRADILCKDTATGDWVLIENQLERTDHIHMGQLLTYAAGLQAVTIVWVASKFTEEHQATLDWLNEITDDRFRFFGLEIELWRIGDSTPAPKFNIVSKPNDWSRVVGQAASRIADADLSETKSQQLAYWTALRDFLSERGSPLRSQKPLPQHWTLFGIGRAGFTLTAKMNTRENRLGVELYIGHDEAKPFFYLLQDQKHQIQSEMGFPLSWEELPDRKGSRLAVYRDGVDPTDEDSWGAQHLWISEMLETFNRVLRDRVRDLNPDDWAGEAGEL